MRVEAHQPRPLVLRAEVVSHYLSPNLASRAVFGNLLKEIVVRVEEKAESRTEIVHFESAPPSPLHILHSVVQRERQFLQCRRSGLANVISADGNGVEARRELGAKLEGIDYQPHRRRRRIDIFLLRDVLLENVVLNRPRNLVPVCPLLLRHDQVHRPQNRCRRIDGHRDCGLFQVNPAEENFHVFQRIDGHAALANLAFARGVVGVVAHQRGQIEGDGESTAAMLEQILVALVGLLGRCEAGELPHGVKLAPISGGVNAARVRRLAGVAEIFFLAPVFGQIGMRVEPAHGNAGDCGETGVSVCVEVDPGGRANRPLGRFFERGLERLLRPVSLGAGGMSVFKNVGDGIFRNLRFGPFLFHTNPSVLL